ncbi:alpha/beta hydrolase [Aequorivita echinoideorum]|uniref:Alpha/beta hydrolase n=1 Tax=Aequorivita echinoideorum TaxID=1549647 RepID=A0ABS5S4N9_9FLAO|nr:alpha/beta hydrolase-fold protein [Aequorivita echinoideorum]MBT0607380.1 alpha/beta hydrolase [Aequorivita echinoideorum]
MYKIILCALVAFSFIGCGKKGIVPTDPVPAHEDFIINSKILGEERVINVWLPTKYKESQNGLPVLYMPDGGIKEDFPHIANTLEKLISEEKIPPFILVGIENTNRRRDLTGPSEVAYDKQYVPEPGGSNNFREFIKDELFPKIENSYRTKNKKALIGESLAGLFVVETLLLDQGMFDAYMAMDPSLWYNENYLVKNFESLTKDGGLEGKKFWFAGSSAEDIYTHTRELARKLERNSAGMEWKYTDAPKEKHNTIFRATKEEAMIWALN